MSERQITGCAYCEAADVDVSLCCRRHARLVCDSCRKKDGSYNREHQEAA